MILATFNSREAVEIGAELADQFARRAAPSATMPDAGKKSENPLKEAVEEILRRVHAEVRPRRLNFYKRAKFANSFRWRLIENGVDKETAEQVTQALLIHLGVKGSGLAQKRSAHFGTQDQLPHVSTQQLLTRGDIYAAEGACADAIACYQDLIGVDPRNVSAHNNLGAAIRIAPNFPDPHSNLGNLLRLKGRTFESESLLRRALRLNPRLVGARINLSLTLVFMGRTREAKGQLDKVLKSDPRNGDALCALALVAKTEGRF